MSILITILTFIFTLGILITFHEWGHFFAARKCGVKVLRFSVGFGKPIWRHIAKDGTEYCIGCLPLGGYVKMLDERESEVAPQDLAFAFNRQSVGKRIAIVAAGPIANFIFAILALAAVYTIGTRDFAPMIDKITQNSIAQQIGLQVQDEIVAINDKPTQNAQMVRRVFLEDTQPDAYVFTLKRNEALQTATLPASALTLTPLDEAFFTELGFHLSVPASIGSVLENSPAAHAGLQPLDRIIAINQEPITSWFEFVTQMTQYPGKSVALTILRDQHEFNVMITPEAKIQNGQTIGQIGVAIDPQLLRTMRFSPIDSLLRGVQDTWFYSYLTLDSIFKMLIGQLGLEHLSGPISIAVYAGDTVQLGLTHFLQFLALLSISLGVINLLPIPMLDGGHLLYYALEVIMRKPLSFKAQQMGFSIGFILLASLMVLAFYNDVIQLGSR